MSPITPALSGDPFALGLYIPHAEIGEGTIVMHHALINAGARVGRNCIINAKALVEHNAVIEDHCHIATGPSLTEAAESAKGLLLAVIPLLRKIFWSIRIP